MRTEQVLQDEKFKEIYTDEKLRNAVAFAHGCSDKYGKHLHYKALMYPDEYIVSKDQIQEAKNELERGKAEKVKNMKAGQLVFVGMGTEYKSRFDGDLCNHRIRTYFKNDEGRCFFIEVGTGKMNEMRCDHSIDVDLENKHSQKLNENYNERKKEKKGSDRYMCLMDEQEKWLKQPYNNFGKIEHMNLGIYSKENLLKTINEVFGCSYSEIEVDNYTLRTDDFICFC